MSEEEGRSELISRLFGRESPITSRVRRWFERASDRDRIQFLLGGDMRWYALSAEDSPPHSYAL